MMMKKINKNDNSNLFENDINFIDNQNSNNNHEQVCNLKFEKIQTQQPKIQKRINILII